ncbi:hypothetical protein F4808DRAFT_211182 [Astrocystis sublimbata]|nr:hypothetical protein F4808DRAFT_211182 [Astrocystis sublimbata]
MSQKSTTLYNLIDLIAFKRCDAKVLELNLVDGHSTSSWLGADVHSPGRSHSHLNIVCSNAQTLAAMRSRYVGEEDGDMSFSFANPAEEARGLRSDEGYGIIVVKRPFGDDIDTKRMSENLRLLIPRHSL